MREPPSLRALVHGLAFVLLSCVSTAPIARCESRPQHVILRAAGLLDVETGRVVRPAEIVVRGDRIIEVRARTARPPAGARVVDLGPAFLLPGLIDTHVHLMLGGPGSRNALATLDAGAGIDGIAHSGFAADSTLETMRSRGIYLVPTLRSFEAQPRTPALDSLLAHMRRQLSQGILIAFGTDAGVIPHGRNAREFGALIRHGLGPAAALRSATVDAARFLGLGDRIGRLAPRLLADVIAVDGDPLEDPTALERVTFVMRAGHIHRGPSSKAR